jgi:Recombinase/Recombinase zinc beta ribbon domain
VANLGNRSLGRKVALGRVGAYQGHPVPIGMALQLRTEAGLEKWTVETEDDCRLVQDYPDGREHWFEPGSKPGDRKKGELLFLVPTRRHPERLAWVKQAYEWYLAESVSMHAIAARLTNLGARTTGGGPFYSALVQRLLEAQCYTGYGCYGRRRQGRYSTIVGGLATPTPGDGRRILKPASEWVWSEAPVYEPPIISRDAWERTQQKIASAKGGPRAPVNSAILLSGLPVCMGCGLKMVGHTSREKGRREAVFFGCSNYAKYKARNPTGCGPGLVRQDKLLAVLRDWMEQSGEALREAAGVADAGLLAPLHAERAGLKAALALVQRAVEGWLFDALGRVLPFEELPGGRRRFTFERHEEPDLVLTLPGCENPVGLHEVFGAASSAAARRSRERIAELEVEAGRMITAWHELPTASAKAMAGERLKAIEREQEELRSGVLDLQAQYKRIWAGLNDTATRLLRARREMAGDSDRRKALAIRGLVERIECTFGQPELEREGGRRMVRRLVGVKVIPLGPDDEEGCVAGERRPPRY